MNELWSHVPLFADRADAGKALAAELENECGPGLARRTASTTASGPHTFRNVSFMPAKDAASVSSAVPDDRTSTGASAPWPRCAYAASIA